MARYIVDSQIDNHEKYYFIREQESQDIVLLPSKYLMHKKRSKLSPNTIRRSAGAISYYLNYIDETGIQLDDVWEMPYNKQQEHFTDYLIWLQAGLHSGDSYKKKPYNETCNAYLKEVFRFYRFSGQQDESTKQLKVLSDMRIIVHNSVGVKRTLYRNTFHGYLQEKGHIGKTIEQDKIVILLKACANCRDQILLLLLAETGFRIGELLGVRYATDIDYERHLLYVNFREDKMIAVNKAESEQKIKKAIRAIDDMGARGLPISVTELVRWTGLSRGFFYKNVQVRQKLEEAIKQPRRIDVQQPSEERNAADYNFQELKKDFNSCQSENQRLKAENEQLLQKCSILQKEVDTLKKRLDRKEIALLKKL